MSTACVFTPAVPTHVYKQYTAACPLLVFSHQLLQQKLTNSVPQHVHCLCSHSSCYNRRLHTAHRSINSVVIPQKLLQQTFTNSIRQHVHCFCSDTSCYNTRFQTANRSMSTVCVLKPAVPTQVYKQHTATCLLIVFSHQLLQQTFKNSIPQHVHFLCSHKTVTTDVYKQRTAACPLLVFTFQLLQQTFTNSTPQHIFCLCSHNSCYNRSLQRAYGSQSTACVLTPAVTTHVYKQHMAAGPQLVFSQHCYNRRLKTVYRSMPTASVLKASITTHV